MFPSLLTSSWLRLATLASIALVALMAAFAAGAATADPPPLPSAAFAEEEYEGEAEDEGEDEEGEEFDEEEQEEAQPLPSDVCPLRSASAHASTKRDKLKLTIGYSTNEPFTAAIQLRKGAIGIETFKRHLGKSGVLRFAEDLGKGSGKLSVHFKLPPGSAGCPSRRLVLFPR